MDDTTFALSGPFRVLHQAGIRYLLPGPPPQKRVDVPSGSAPGQEATPSPSSVQEVPFEAPWTDFLAKVPASPIFLFTYKALGADLAGGGSSERSALWRSIVGALSLPRGSVGFWPCLRPGTEDDPVPAPQFGEGLRRIAPRVLVDFSAEGEGGFARRCLMDANAAFGLNISYFPAPSPEELLLAGPEGCNTVARQLLELLQAG
ncbi:hypothetical protein [Fundidesulfovibrio agrisoli]|uniref:hypothetical protein n=1 Tax=Fundidesulfovibrio agrisoli TaxID=2922717 RepID=UPI001FAB7852|nr:hypothetical protein [Fundidesulfovibrio agrisoli]